MTNLLQLFRDLEDINDIKGLNQLSEIFRGILMLSHTQLVQYTLQETNFMTIIGIFEYDLQLKTKGNNRDFFQFQVKLKEIIPLNEKIKLLINNLYKMKYLKDYILRPTIDETGTNALQNMIVNSSIEIATQVCLKQYMNQSTIVL